MIKVKQLLHLTVISNNNILTGLQGMNLCKPIALWLKTIRVFVCLCVGVLARVCVDYERYVIICYTVVLYVKCY